MVLIFLVPSVAAFGVTVLVKNLLVQRFFIVVSVAFLGVFLYVGYAYWLLEKDDKSWQKRFWSLVVDLLNWDGRGTALDIGTGSGPVAISLAKRHPTATVMGIDYWGEPWTYSQEVCEENARIEGVSDRVCFQWADAVSLPFIDGEFDAVISCFVFHAIDVEDRTVLIKEALRVLRSGGAFSFQDLFNDEFYREDFMDEIMGWGLKEVNYVSSSDYIDVPTVLRIKHIAGGSGVLYGIK